MGIDETDKPFAYYVDEEIHLFETCQGESIQVVDMAGHVVFSTDIPRIISTIGMPPGIYVLRLIARDNVKTQEIVVK